MSFSSGNCSVSLILRKLYEYLERNMRILAVLCSVFVLLSAGDAYARPKPTYWFWWPGHWENQDFKPFADDPMMVHNSQWEQGLYVDSEWHPQNWIDTKGSMRAVLDGFYDYDIIREQTVDGHIPVLIVGDGYMNLSGLEKRRVADFVDYVFQVTTTAPAGMYAIYYHRTKTLWGRGDPIGMYTKHGLQMQ